MSVDTFEPGDIVQHKSGGPKMVVVEFIVEMARSPSWPPHHRWFEQLNYKILCSWIEGNKKYEDMLAPATLEHYAPSTGKAPSRGAL